MDKLARILPDRSILKPTIALFVVVFVFQFVEVMYAAFDMELPAPSSMLLSFAFLWAVCWWFDAEFTRTNARWPMDTGMLIYAGWFLLLPVHLVMTRGVRGLLGIGGFIAAIFAGWMAAAVIILLFL